MEYTREQKLTIVNFLDHIGSASFMSGFKDGMLDCRNWLTGVKRKFWAPLKRE